MNLVEYLARATDYLSRHEIPSARLNAELMLCSLLKIERIDIYAGFERELTPVESDRYRDMVVKRGGAYPLQYITGEASFRGIAFEARPGVFIPRPETEVLVEEALACLADIRGNGPAVLDVGTGCGNIAVTLASERADVRVLATDCDPLAVALCTDNAARAGVGDRVEAALGDLYDAAGGRGPFDAIVSNPPYVPAGARDSLPAEVRDHEPEGALFAGEDGLSIITRLIDGADGCLKRGGVLAMEVDESHASEVARILGESGWEEVVVVEDLAGKPRVVRARSE